MTVNVTEPLPDYDVIDHALHELGIAQGAAECHGALCGFVCAAKEVDLRRWTVQVLMAEREQEPHQAAPHGREFDEQQAVFLVQESPLAVLFAVTMAQIDASQFDFHLLLPDDEEPLSRRSEALGLWCRGFLFGLTVGGAKELAGLSEEGNELLRDMVQISRVAHEQAGASNEDESDYAELVEYVRIGVMYVRTELQGRDGPPAKEPQH